MFQKIIHDLLYYDSGELDLSRVCSLAIVLAFICQSGYAVYRGQAFDWSSFGTGAGALMAGCFGGVWMHSKAT